MRVGVVVNPRSGARGRRRGDAAARADLARSVLGASGVDAEIAVTEQRGHGATLSAAFVSRGVDLVIAWGGDGTVNEVAGPLIGSGTALGIVPSGSGDGLARGLGVPFNPADALAFALRGRPDAIDVGFLGSRHFLNIAGIGFDAVVGAAFNDAGGRGALGYVRTGLALVWTYRAREYHLDLDGRVLSGERFVIGFANAREYGNRLILDHSADPRDGWLNVVVGDRGSPLTQLWRARRLAIRPHRPAAGVYRTRVQRARVTGDELACHVDGEHFTTSGTVDVRLEPRALRIVARTSAGTSRSSSRES